MRRKRRDLLNRNEVLRRLCALAAKVREHKPLTDAAGQSLAADCFCEQSAPRNAVLMAAFRGSGLANYRFDASVMAFIEAAVESALSDPAVDPDVEKWQG